MPQIFFDWSNWVFGTIGTAVGVLGLLGWQKASARRTINTIEGGSRNVQTGADGTTTNTVTKGDNNQQSG